MMFFKEALKGGVAELYSKDEWLRDGSEKPGEGLCVAMRRTCNGQPGLWLNKTTTDDSPKMYHLMFLK